jgi:hypothetical protein
MSLPQNGLYFYGSVCSNRLSVVGPKKGSISNAGCVRKILVKLWPQQDGFGSQVTASHPVFSELAAGQL